MLRQLFRIPVLVLLAAGIIGLLPAIHADEINPTITDVYFSKDDSPWNEPVEFTVNCYGYLCKSWDCKRDEADLNARRYGNFTPELVFTYHASCPAYGCRIHEPYYHAERNFGTTCNIEGVTQGTAFSVLNVSQSAVPENCTALHQFMRSCGREKYCNATQEFDDCIAETRRHRDRCNQYIAECDPASDTGCRNWVLDGKNVKETPSYRACVDTVYREQADCEQYLERIDPKRMVMWTDPRDRSEFPAMRSCEFRVAIPSATAPPVPTLTFGARATATAEYHNPVATMFCSIVSLFGGMCE